jgi:two-component system chemotaxis response regulator CheB
MRLKEMLEADAVIKVVGEAANGDQVLELIESASPQVLLVDLQMPGTGGHATIERVMANHPLPILVVTAAPEGTRRDAVFESIRRGALDLAEKPTPNDRGAQARLRRLVRELSTVPVVRHVAGKLARSNAQQASAIALQPDGGRLGNRIIGIAASAGGPSAVVAVLSELRAGPNASVALVQHLPLGFAASFAQFLQSRIALPVSIVERSERIGAGRVYMAPDDHHLVAIDHQTLAASPEPPVEGHRPSCDVLFRSLAARFGFRAAGVVLSGIGRDGVSGLADMRARGALTLAQHASSCAVFGMPRAALESRAASEALEPREIARALMGWLASPIAEGPRPT